MIPLEPAARPAHNFEQVLVTPTQAVPRSVIAVFLCLNRIAPLGDGPIRKDGRPTCVGLRTSPARAFVSAGRSLDTRSIPA